MALTRQEAADALVATGLDRQSLEAILQAVKSVNEIGFGMLSFEVKEGQIVWWKSELSKKIDRKKLDSLP